MARLRNIGFSNITCNIADEECVRFKSKIKD